MNKLRLRKTSFSLCFTADTVLPSFVGNTVRGALGHALDDLGSPAYREVFKTENADSIPNPYTISVPYPSKVNYKKGDVLTFDVILFGKACEFSDEVATAVKHMCRGKLENCLPCGDELIYDRVWSDAGAESIPDTGSLTIFFKTPTEFLSSHEPVWKIDWNTFVDILFGRICDIIGNYTESEFVLPYPLIARRPFVTADYSLTPVHLIVGTIPINGVLGSVKYTGNVTRYLPYIDLGSQIHIGKKTTLACGEYSFEI